MLTGFVIPKFGSDIRRAVFLDAVADASELLGKHLYAMPVLESPALVHRETRDAELRTIWVLARTPAIASSRSASAPPTCAAPSASGATAI